MIHNLQNIRVVSTALARLEAENLTNSRRDDGRFLRIGMHLIGLQKHDKNEISG
jgi:hypothetical protein